MYSLELDSLNPNAFLLKRLAQMSSQKREKCESVERYRNIGGWRCRLTARRSLVQPGVGLLLCCVLHVLPLCCFLFVLFSEKTVLNKAGKILL